MDNNTERKKPAPNNSSGMKLEDVVPGAFLGSLVGIAFGYFVLQNLVLGAILGGITGIVVNSLFLSKSFDNFFCTLYENRKFPVCSTGICKASDYTWKGSNEGNPGVEKWECGCGQVYELLKYTEVGSDHCTVERFLEVREDGNRRPFMIRENTVLFFPGWKRDSKSNPSD